MSAVLPKLLHLQAWGRRHSASLKTARPFHREPDPMPAVDSIHPKQGTVSTAPNRTSGRALQQNTHSPHTLLGAAQKHTTGAGLEREEPNTHKLLAGSRTPNETRSKPGHLYSDAAPSPASQRRLLEPIYRPVLPRGSPHLPRPSRPSEARRSGEVADGKTGDLGLLLFASRVLWRVQLCCFIPTYSGIL